MPLLIIFGLAVLYVAAYRPPLPSDPAPINPALSALRTFLSGAHQLGLFVFRSQSGLQWVFVTAIAAHVGEAMVAVVKSAQAGLGVGLTVAWGIQTLLWGYPSLGPLLHTLKRLREMRARGEDPLARRAE
jgi:hypothetical protein